MPYIGDGWRFDGGLGCEADFVRLASAYRGLAGADFRLVEEFVRPGNL